MRIYMQQSAMDDKPPRFCHLYLQEDLLEGWSLVKENGIQGAAGRVLKTHFENYTSALEALMRVRDQHLNKGYRVVFAQGDSRA